ncbi:piggyBac transposable element-derived protein 3-like [Macrobrachium rosenbergii]|uniref:piggyBac transposable element-derived protein 3-like n=1 Tax=Macrobrachium rosenbergii TaxID=79674 RepID=UPI0034D4D754
MPSRNNGNLTLVEILEELERLSSSEEDDNEDHIIAETKKRYCSVSRRRLYWSTESDTHNELISNSMRRNRFEEIMRYFYAADNTDLNPDDKFAKVRPFLDILNKNYLSYGKVFGPSTISIDESMMPYFGRHPTKPFIRGKPIRWGYKAWAACTPLGYAFTLDLYQGSNPNEYASEYGLGGKVILNILDTLQAEYPRIKFSLYFDNFFASRKLLEEIKRRGHGAIGTLRANRVEKCPLTINKKFEKLPRASEEHFLKKDSQILVVRWNDNGVVSTGSNEHGTFPMKKVERYSAKEKKKVSVGCPRLIDIYNQNMGGVDRADENICHNRIAIRGIARKPCIGYIVKFKR